MQVNKEMIDASDIESEINTLCGPDSDISSHTIKNKKVVGYLSVNITENFHLTFYKCDFQEVDLDSLKIGSLRFRDCNIKKLYLYDLKGGRILLTGRKNKIEQLLIDNSIVDFSISDYLVEEASFTTLYEDISFYLRSRNTHFGSLFLNDNAGKGGGSRITGGTIKNLQVGGLIKSYIYLEYISNIELVSFNNLRVFPGVDLSFDNLSVNNPKEFKVANSILYEVLIKNSNLRDLRLVVSDSDISEISTFNTQLPVVHPSNNLFQDKETCRQLKKAFENNSDKIKAKEYGAEELEFYLKYLESERLPFWQRFPLWISKVTNDFGRSWQLAFWSLLGWSALFYLIIGVLQSDDSTSFFDFLLSGSFFQFLFPLHSLESIVRPGINEYEILVGPVDILPFSLSAVAFIQRLFSGFYIYQLIRAFRFHYNV